MSEKVYSLVIKQGSGKRVVRFVFGRWRYPSAQVYMMRQWENEWVIHNWPLFACKLFHSHIESMLVEETSEMRKNWASWTTQVTYPLASESLHLFQHIWPMLRPFSFYHFHNYSWQGIFDVALLVQDRMSTLKRDNRRHQSSTTVNCEVKRLSQITLTFDNSCMAHSFRWTFSCCCMSFHLNLQGDISFLSNMDPLSCFFPITFTLVTFYLLDDMLQDLQTKVSHYCWLGFVS